MQPTQGEHGHSRREALEVLNALRPPHSADASLWISPSRRCIAAASIYIHICSGRTRKCHGRCARVSEEYSYSGDDEVHVRDKYHPRAKLKNV